ncbi:MAG: glycosyltransferase family 39 protein [Chloroflexota bacterium]
MTVAVALGIRFAFLYRAPVFLSGDSESHFLPGFDLARGAGFDPELRRPAGYALLAAATIAILGEDLRSMAMAQHLGGVLSAAATCVLGRLCFGWSTGLAAGLLTAVSGPLLLSEHSIMTEAPFGTLLLLTLLTTLLTMKTGRVQWAIPAGVGLGLCILTRPVAQILLPLLPLAVIALRGRDRRSLVAAAAVLAGCALVVMPWSARNWVEHGSFTASGGLGRSLTARTIKYDTGFFESDVEPAGPGDLKGEVRQYVRGARNRIRNGRSVRPVQAGIMSRFGLTQAQSDSLMRQIALDEIARRPLYYVAGSIQMAGQILVGREKEDGLAIRWEQRTDKEWVEQWQARVDHLLVPTSASEEAERGVAQRLAALYQPTALGPTVPLFALVGAIITLFTRETRSGVLLSATAAALVLTSAFLDGPVPRYRYPIDPLLTLLATAAVFHAIAALRRVGSTRGRFVAATA